MEETVEADEARHDLPQFTHRPERTTNLNNTPNHDGHQYTYAWDSYVREVKQSVR
jgi:hypothetical protein